MGWTGQHATHYKNGRIDRKAECDGYFMEGLNAGHYEVLKSTMIGSVYYAAVRNKVRYAGCDADNNPIYEPVENAPIWAAVFLTQVDSRDYFNFLYKDMDETVGPCEDRCPASILKLLSPTDSEWANEWRERCRKNIEGKKDPRTLKNLPIGATIRFTNWKGESIELMKHAAAYQFKRPFWYNADNNTYMPATRIPDSYEVISA